jgi:hypothetical protein
MVRKTFICVSLALFAALLLACSKPKTDNSEKSDSQDTSLPPGWDSAAGFFLHGDHKYGFDRHTDDPSGDSVAYASVLAGDSAVAAVKTNKEAGFDYFICKPGQNRIDSVKSIGSSRNYRYAVATSAANAGDSLIFALCRRVDEDRTEIVQELRVRPYKWRDDFDFHVYILGDSASSEDRHQLLNRDAFWNTFDSVFRQAVVKHRRITKKFIPASKGYILTKAEGWWYQGNTYDTCGSDNISDVSRAMNEIVSSASNADRKRAIIQVGYPTKRFWPLRTDASGNIQICSHQDSVSKFRLKLEPIPNPKVTCPPFTNASVSKSGGIWKLKYSNGTEAIANEVNVNRECAVFAEDSLSNYVGEVNYNNEAWAAMFGPINNNVSIAVEPWLGDSRLTARLALHELGHTMGLVDIYNNDNNSGTYDIGRENNLMGYADNYKLRKRGMAPPGDNYNYVKCADYYKDKNKCMEYQWDCLQKNSYDFCVVPFLDPHYTGPRYY